MQAEIHVNDHLHRYRMTLIHRRPEPVLLHGFDSSLVETHAEMTNDVDVLRAALRIDDS